MNRRGFLSLLTAAIPAAILAPELILPRRTFFMPPKGGWSVGNPYLTSNTAWFLMTDEPMPLYDRRFSNQVRPGADLSEATLEQLLIELRKVPHPFLVPPLRFIGSRPS